MYLIYTRKSSESEDRQILSIDSQVSELLALADRQGLRVAGVLRESQSARTPGRPVFTKLLRRVLEGGIQGILCWKLDRLARNPVDGGALIWAFDQSKLPEIITPERSYANTTNDKFWLQLEFGIAKKYVDDLSDNVKRGNDAKLQQGGLPGAAPIGYVNDRLAHTVVPDPDRFVLIRRLWELVLEGNSPLRALEFLNGAGGLRTRKTTRSGGKPFSRSALYHLLRSPFYYGEIARKGTLYPGAHRPMVTKEEFDAVQALLRHGRRGSQRRNFRYRQLLRCGECGAMITAATSTNRYGYRYTYYRCTKRRTGHPCSQSAIRSENLKGQIEEVMARIDVPVAYLDWALRHPAGPEGRRLFQGALRSNQVRTLAGIDQQRERLVDLHIRSLVTEDDFVVQRRRLDASESAIRQQMTDKELRTDPGQLLTEPFVRLLHDYLRRAPNKQATQVLALLGSYTLLDRRVSFVPHTPFRQI